MLFKKLSKKIIVFFISLALVVGMMPVSGISARTKDSYDEIIAFVHTNDVHGHIEVEPYVKALADNLKASGKYSLVLTVSAGDIYGGGESVAGYYQGELIPQIVDRVYDVIVPGNNDFGTDPSKRQEYNLFLTSLYTHTKTICANSIAAHDIDMPSYAASYIPKISTTDLADMYDGISLNTDGSLDYSGLNLPVIARGENPYEQTVCYLTDKGTKIGLFGLTVNGMRTDSEISESKGSVEYAQSCIDELESDGATVVVGIGHTGWKGEGSQENADANDTNSWVLANSVTGMDAYIDGHSHSIIGDGKGCYVGKEQVFVNQAQCFGVCIGFMELYVKDGKVVKKQGNILKEDDLKNINPDPAIQEIVDADLSRVKHDLDTPYSMTSFFLNGERISAGNNGGTIRGNETNLGDFITDVLLQCASIKTGKDYDFLLFPGVAIRSSISPGTITKNNLTSLFGLDISMGAKKYTAEEILEIIQNSLSGGIYPDKESVSFFQMSGIKMTYEYSDGKGIPVTITVNDDLIYDLENGGILVDDTWTAEGISFMMQPDDNSEIIFGGSAEIIDIVAEYLSSHVSGVDYNVYSNVIAPDRRIVEINTKYEAAETDHPQLQQNTMKIKAKTSKSKPKSIYSLEKTKVKLEKIAKISDAVGNVTYEKISGDSKIKVNQKTGKITIKKGLEKGIYKIKIKITASGNGLYNMAAKTVAVYFEIRYVSGQCRDFGIAV